MLIFIKKEASDISSEASFNEQMFSHLESTKFLL